MRSCIIISLQLLLILGSRESALGSDSLMFRIVAIERQVMNIEDDVLKASLLMKKAGLYKEAGKYKEAFSSLQRINVNTLEAAIKDSLHYEKAFNLFMLGSFPAALQELWDMRDVHHYSEACTTLYLMALLEDQQWDDFRQEYLRLAKAKGIDTAAFVADFAAPVVMNVDRYERLAKIPGLGLGLFKAGYVRRGFASASLQILLAGVAVWQIATGYYFTGFFSGLLPARRFYNGGKILTATSVAETNEKRIANVKRIGYSFISKMQ